MRRMPTAFYRDVHALRAKYGDTEYSRKSLVAPIADLIEMHREDCGRELLLDQAEKILDSIEKAEDQSSGGLFPYEGHVALGETQRIKRGKMNISQHYRRKRVIDSNKVAQDRAWAEETAWINDGIDALTSMPINTKRCDVLNEVSDPVGELQPA